MSGLVPGGQFQYVPHQEAVSANGNGQAAPVTEGTLGAFSTWCVQIAGTFSAVVHFEGTVDGTNWVAVEMESVGSSTTKATSANAAGVWRGNVLGLSQVRARVAWTSGTSVTVVGQLVVG